MKARPLIPRPQAEYFFGQFGLNYVMRWQNGQLSYWSMPVSMMGQRHIGNWVETQRDKQGRTGNVRDNPQNWEAISFERAKELIPMAFGA